MPQGQKQRQTSHSNQTNKKAKESKGKGRKKRRGGGGRRQEKCQASTPEHARSAGRGGAGTQGRGPGQVPGLEGVDAIMRRSKPQRPSFREHCEATPLQRSDAREKPHADRSLRISRGERFRRQSDQRGCRRLRKLKPTCRHQRERQAGEYQ
jgi:hypothetical protein